MSQLDPAAASPEGSAGLDATGLPRNVENWAKALKHVADHFNVNDLRDAVAVDYVLRAASALPSLIDAKQLADDRGKALAEAAREINCAGPVAHRIRILKQEHAAQLTEARSRTSELEKGSEVDLFNRNFAPIENELRTLRLSREQAIAAIDALPRHDLWFNGTPAGICEQKEGRYLLRDAVLAILRSPGQHAPTGAPE